MAENQQPQKIPLIFFRTPAGSEPVREWLKELPEEERRAIGTDLLRAQWRWPVGMPLCRADGQRTVGDSDGPADKADGASADLHIPGAPGRAARVYQENARDAG